MGLRKLLILGVAAAGVMVSGCGDDNDGNANLRPPTEGGQGGAEAASIDGTWVSDCKQVQTIVGLTYEKRTLIFSDGQLQRRLEYFESNACEDAKFIVKMTGTATLHRSAEAADEENFGEIDIHLTGATAVGKSEAVIEKLKEFVYCGRSEWILDEEQEITGEFTAGACPVLRVPDRRYGLYKVEENHLLLSDYIDQMATEEAERGQSFDVQFARDSD